MRRNGVRLHWAMPPRGVRGGRSGARATEEWRNLALSGASGVMLPLWLATEQGWIVEELAAGGYSVIVRVLDENLWSAAERVERLGAMCDIEGVIIRNEPDMPYNLTWGGAWGNEAGGGAERFGDELGLAARIFTRKVVSGALSCRWFRENDPPQPGLGEWAAIARGRGANAMPNAGHAYQYGWHGDVDRIAMKNRLRLLGEIHHREIWLTELGIHAPTMGQVEKMRAYIEVLRWLGNEEEFGAAVRYEMAIPFVARATEEWRAYIIDDPEAYRLLGGYVAGG